MEKKNVLFFKTANDHVFGNMLAHYAQLDANKYCLIQASALARYSRMHQDITFISLGVESYYDVADSVIQQVAVRAYDTIYIPTTAPQAIGFDNVIQLVRHLQYERLVFFHSPSDRHEVKRMSAAEEARVREEIREIEQSLA